MEKFKHRLLAALLSVSCITTLVGCRENANDEGNSSETSITQSSEQTTSQEVTQSDPVVEVKDKGTIFTDFAELAKWKEAGAIGLAVDIKNADDISLNASIEIAAANNDVYLKVPSFELTMTEGGEKISFKNIELYVNNLQKAYINADTFYDIFKLASGEDAQETIDQISTVVGDAKYIMFDIEQLAENGSINVTTEVSDEQLDIIKEIGSYFVTNFMPVIEAIHNEHADVFYTAENGIHSITIDKNNVSEFTEMLKSFINSDEFITASKDMMGFIAKLDENAELPSDEEFDEKIADVRSEASESLDALAEQINNLNNAKYTISTQIIEDGSLGGLKGDVFSLTIGLEAKGEIAANNTDIIVDVIGETTPQTVDMNIAMVIKAINAKTTVNLPTDDISCDLMAKMAEMQGSANMN